MAVEWKGDGLGFEVKSTSPALGGQDRWGDASFYGVDPNTDSAVSIAGQPTGGYFFLAEYTGRLMVYGGNGYFWRAGGQLQNTAYPAGLSEADFVSQLQTSMDAGTCASGGDQ